MLLGNMLVDKLLDMPISLCVLKQDNLLLLSIPIPMVLLLPTPFLLLDKQELHQAKLMLVVGQQLVLIWLGSRN